MGLKRNVVECMCLRVPLSGEGSRKKRCLLLDARLKKLNKEKRFECQVWKTGSGSFLLDFSVEIGLNECRVRVYVRGKKKIRLLP